MGRGGKSPLWGDIADGLGYDELVKYVIPVIIIYGAV